MSEQNENKTENTEPSEQTEKQYSAIEQKAIEQGWVPKEEFDGEEAEFIDAPEFVRRGELFAKIEHQSKEVKQLRQALEALKQFNGTIQEQAYNKALKELQAKKKAARADGDHEQADIIDEQIDEIKEEKAEFATKLEQVPTAVQSDPVFESWQANNSWYGKDKAMTAYADEVGRELRREVLAGALSKEQAFQEIAKQVKQEFKHKFSNPKATRASAVESPSRGGRSGFDGGSFQLTDTERTVMRKIVASGVMTEKEYIKQLKETREV
jgi:hypothetical protein